VKFGFLDGEALAQLGGVRDGHLGEIRQDDVVGLLEVSLDFGDQVLFFGSHVGFLSIC